MVTICLFHLSHHYQPKNCAQCVFSHWCVGPIGPEHSSGACFGWSSAHVLHATYVFGIAYVSKCRCGLCFKWIEQPTHYIQCMCKLTDKLHNIKLHTMTMTNDNENMFITTDIYSISEQMQDINTSEKASNSNLPLIISMVMGAWSRSLWAPISVIRKKTFHFEGAENKKKKCMVRGEWHRFIYIREWSIIVYIIPGYEIVRFACVWSCIHDHTCWSC